MAAPCEEVGGRGGRKAGGKEGRKAGGWSGGSGVGRRGVGVGGGEEVAETWAAPVIGGQRGEGGEGGEGGKMDTSGLFGKGKSVQYLKK